MGWGKVDRDANPRWDLQEQIKMATTDTAPKTPDKTLVKEIGDAIREELWIDYDGEIDLDTLPDAAEAAARVLLERMIQEFPETPVVWFEAFARKHGLSAEDERE